MNFWEVVKELSAQTIRKESERLFVLALVGDAEQTFLARDVAFGAATPEQRVAAQPFFCTASPPYDAQVEARLRHSDLVVSLSGGPGITDFRPADCILLDDPAKLVHAVLERRPDLRIPIARRFPGFRQAAAEQVIRDVSRVNAEFAALTGVVPLIPGLATLFPFESATDIMMLTKNQFLMMYRLAAIYGEDLTFLKRLRENVPVAGGALGWRAIARELAGALGPLGIPIRCGIAFTGTYTTGRAAQMLFDQGRRPTRREMARIYEEAADLAKDVVARLKERVRKNPSLSAPKPELPDIIEASEIPVPPALSVPRDIPAENQQPGAAGPI